MILDPTTEVTLYDLLSQREHAFAKIYEYEQRIEQVLGTEYKAYDKPTLPSLAKKRKKAATKTKVVRRTIRRLKPDTEDAYLIDYVYNGEPQTEILREYRLVQSLVKNDIPNLHVNVISSIIYTSDEEFDIVTQLFTNHPPS